MAFEKEIIQNEDNLYCFIHQANIDYKKGGVPRAAAFQNTPKEGDNLSSDWDKYSTPELTLKNVGKQFNHHKQQFKDPALYGVLKLNVKDLRSEDFRQIVEHDPIFNELELFGIPNNQAHSVIIGEKDEETRLNMVKKSEWMIKPTST